MPQIIDKSATTPAAGDYLLSQASGGLTSKVTPVAVRDGGAVYGALYYSNNTGTDVNLGTQNVWYGTKFLVAGAARGVTQDVSDATSDHLTIVTAGTYRIMFTACADPDADGTYEIGIHVDGTACSRGGIAIVSPSVSDSISGHSLVSLAAGKEISVRARCTSAASKVLKFFVISLSAERIGA